MNYTPIYIKEFNLYDIFHNDNNNIIIVSPGYNKSFNIKYKNNLFDIHFCKDKHTHIYVLTDEIEYNEEIEINIDGKNIYTKVNKYPCFKDEIIMSTMVYNEDNYIRQWINFHNNIGINRFIIYDNSDINDNKSYKSMEMKSDLQNVLRDFIKSGLVILIKWSYPKRCTSLDISGQTSQQNHSIWAFKCSKYIGLFDIDEYINMQTNDKNIYTYFNSLIQNNNININDIGSFTLNNKFFYNPNNLPTNGYNFLKIYNCDTLIGGTQRAKNFVIPNNVYTYSIHAITKGKRMYNLNNKNIYFNHYCFLNKLKRGRNKTDLIDTSIQKHMHFIINMDEP